MKDTKEVKRGATLSKHGTPFTVQQYHVCEKMRNPQKFFDKSVSVVEISFDSFLIRRLHIVDNYLASCICNNISFVHPQFAQCIKG